MARQQSDAKRQNFWSASPERPYYHASDAGLPVIALCHYLTLESDDALKQECQQAIQSAIAFELEISQEVANPFSYPRQYVKDVGGTKRSSFFISQNNESGYWWQGENARLGSLACMGLLVKPLLDDSLQSKTSGYSSQCLNWILGANPFDICMLDGHGRNNPDYLPNLASSTLKVESVMALQQALMIQMASPLNPSLKQRIWRKTGAGVSNGYPMQHGSC
ncbi:glucosamine-link cellobiase [Vibrio ishigakensis]|uniref:Glucosamine-link cellobiase n=1 Tax=Vibrio ishigakensis TaxID=1481914 RepID=A0A0B8P4S7_9VIBR|nr:glucosamine-link cellobiase [Vibrio ishigakensis]